MEISQTMSRLILFSSMQILCLRTERDAPIATHISLT